jgi:DNA-binding GntR family transcriptional regulator
MTILIFGTLNGKSLGVSYNRILSNRLSKMKLVKLRRAGQKRGMKRDGEVVVALAQAIKAAILEGTFQAGETLPETEIMWKFACSRTSAREALRMVIHSGLTVKTPNQSNRVVTFEERDLNELTSLRLILEQLGARIGFQRPALLEGMHAAVDALRVAVAQADMSRIFAANRRFHEAIIQAADHGRLSQAYTQLSDQIEFAFRTLGRRQRDIKLMVSDHERLCELARRGDFDGFMAELTQHIRSGLTTSALLLEPAAHEQRAASTAAAATAQPHRPVGPEAPLDNPPSNSTAGLGW